MPHVDIGQRRKYQREWRARRRADWLAANGPCVDCGSWDRLEVDHVEPEQKVDHKVWSWSDERRLAELAKCVVRCAPCHLKRTVQQRRRPVQHGTHAGYSYHGCRCRPCRDAHAAYNRRFR